MRLRKMELNQSIEPLSQRERKFLHLYFSSDVSTKKTSIDSIKEVLMKMKAVVFR